MKHQLASAWSKVGAAATAKLVWILAPRLPEHVTRAAERVERAVLARVAAGRQD